MKNTQHFKKCKMKLKNIINCLMVFLVLIVSVSATLHDYDLTDNLIAYWSLDETSGNISYDKTGNHNADNLGMVINLPGKNGKAYYSKTDDRLNPKLNLTIGKGYEFALSVWVNFNNSRSGGGSCFFSYLGDNLTQIMRFRITNANRTDFPELSKGELNLNIPGFRTANHYLLSSDCGLSHWALNEWVHIVFNLNKTHICTYYNRDCFSCSEWHENETVITKNKNFVIGAESLTSALGLAAQFDELAIWNTSLTFEEISLLYNDGAGLFYSDFVNSFKVFGSLSPESSCILESNNLTDALFIIILFGSLLFIFIINELFIRIPVINLVLSLSFMGFAIYITPCGVLIAASFYLFAVGVGVLEFMRL
jgi:hypothetical protein